MKYKNNLTILLAFLFAIVPLHVSQAAVIVLQPLDPTSSGEFSNLGPSNQQVADDFLLTQATTLESISWFGRYGAQSVSAPDPTTFSIRFFEDNAGSPTISPIQQLSVTVNPTNSGSVYNSMSGSQNIPWYSYTASLPAIALDAGTYWVSVVENDTSTNLFGNTQWLWADSDTIGIRAYRVNDNEVWTSSLDRDHAFSLSGTVVPIPAAVWLFGSGFIALIGLARRKKA